MVFCNSIMQFLQWYYAILKSKGWMSKLILRLKKKWSNLKRPDLIHLISLFFIWSIPGAFLMCFFDEFINFIRANEFFMIINSFHWGIILNVKMRKFPISHSKSLSLSSILIASTDFN